MRTHAIVKRLLVVLASFFMAAFAIAQERIGEVTVNDSGGSSKWMWVVGAAVFILLLVALTRGGSRSDA